MDKEKNFISMVIYIYNAENRIKVFLENIIQLLQEYFEHSEIICVNDFSSDNSVQEIKKVSNKSGRVAISVVNMSYFHGKEIAMNAGVDLSIGDFVLEMDDTIQDYSMDEVMRVYYKTMEGFDIVSAFSDRRQKLTSKVFYWLYEKCTDGKYKMQSETFRILSRRAINRIGSMSRTVPYRKGLYASCGLRTTSLQYKAIQPRIKRHKEERKIRKYKMRLAMDTLLLFTDAGYSCAKGMTFLMMFVSCFVLIYTIVIYTMAKPIAGWTTTLLFLSIAFFGLFAVLTIIIKYLQMILELNFKRSKYSFESIEKLTK